MKDILTIYKISIKDGIERKILLMKLLLASSLTEGTVVILILQKVRLDSIMQIYLVQLVQIHGNRHIGALNQQSMQRN